MEKKMNRRNQIVKEFKTIEEINKFIKENNYMIESISDSNSTQKAYVVVFRENIEYIYND